MGGPLTVERLGSRDGLVVAALDARLGVDGLPQSATGQTTLFTGINGAELMGHHMTAFPGPTLRRPIAEHSLLLQLTRQGLGATFANAYSDRYLESLEDGSWRVSASTRVVQAAGLPLRRVEDLLRGEAVTWDVHRDLFARRAERPLEAIEAAEAGRHLASLAASHDLTLYESFVTDLAGHQRWGIDAADALARVDGLLGGVLDHRDADTTLLVTSDHGNLEDATTRAHTLNPVPLVVSGPLAGAFEGLTSIQEVTPRIVRVLAGAES